MSTTLTRQAYASSRLARRQTTLHRNPHRRHPHGRPPLQPGTGRFLSVDPVVGANANANANANEYCSADPTNCYDLDGRLSLPKGALKVVLNKVGGAIAKICARVLNPAYAVGCIGLVGAVIGLAVYEIVKKKKTTKGRIVAGVAGAFQAISKHYGFAMKAFRFVIDKVRGLAWGLIRKTPLATKLSIKKYNQMLDGLRRATEG